MKILILILFSIILMLSFSFVWIYNKYINEQKRHKIFKDTVLNTNMAEAITMCMSDNGIEEVYPCDLIVAERDNMGIDCRIFDFSEYETQGIIALTHFKKGAGVIDVAWGDRPREIMIKNTKVVKTKGGEYIWDLLN